MKVFIIAALSADGFIAEEVKQSSLKWTSKEDKRVFITKTKQIGVVVMGRTTSATTKYFPLKDRLNIVYTHQTKEELGKEFNLKKEQMQADRLRVTSLAPKELVAQLEKEGFKQLVVCGGSSIYQQFLEAGVVDELILTVEPIFFGQGMSLFKKPMQKKLKLIESKQINEQGTLVCTYECKN